MKYGVGDAERLALQWSYGPTGIQIMEFWGLLLFLAGGQDNDFDRAPLCEKMKVCSLPMFVLFWH